MIHEQVPLNAVGHRAFLHPDRVRAKSIAAAGRPASGVGLLVKLHDDDVCPCRLLCSKAKLQIPGLVAAEGDVGQVVPLDEISQGPEGPQERRRQTGKANARNG